MCKTILLKKDCFYKAALENIQSYSWGDFSVQKIALLIKGRIRYICIDLVLYSKDYLKKKDI